MGAIFSGTDAEGAVDRARTRVESMSRARLVDWLEAALPGMHRHFDAYQRSGDPAHLGEMALAHMNVGVVLDELLERASLVG